MRNPYLTIVIPTLNEEMNIAKLLYQVKDVIKPYNYEIIVVDGNSEDKTVEIARKNGVRILLDDSGKGSALIKGFRSAKGKIIISMDADLSHRPKELKLLISGIETGYDICVGSRFMTGGGSADMPPFRVFGNKVFVTLVNIFYGSNYTDMCYGYRSFSKEALKKMKLSEKGFGIETEINIMAKKEGMKVLEVPSFEKKRAEGAGKLRSFNDGFIILMTILKNLF
ncbi:MAG: glycosyltransferase family 2 protein [Candidatus Micrarchaeales archaeon]